MVRVRNHGWRHGEAVLAANGVAFRGDPSQRRMVVGRHVTVGFAGFALVLAGCRGVPTRDERQARADLQAVTSVYRPGGRAAALPDLGPGSSLASYLQFAMLHDPEVAARYFDWVASVEKISVARSLPDPRLTFQTDIADVVMSIMPGLMQEFPGPGKLSRRAGVASAGSQARYFEFEERVLGTAFDVKRAYNSLHFLSDRLRINREMQELLAGLERTARARNEVGKATLQDVLRAQIEQDRIANEIENLEDSRKPLVARFKAALGLDASEADPAVPDRFETTPVELDSEAVLATAFARNPGLQALEAEVRRAEASLSLAYKTGVPDFDAGLMVDVKAAPTMFRPLFGMTLPVWRDKIEAEILGARADRDATRARLTSGQIRLSVEFAEQAFAYREITRNLRLLQERLIPKARESLDLARAGYLAGSIDFFNLIDSERTLLGFRLEEVEARTRREIVLAEISLMILARRPESAPLLPQAADGGGP